MSKKLFLIISFVILSACSAKPKVEALKIATGTVESTVSTVNSGTVEAQSQAELAFGTVGRIAKVYVKLGAKVSKETIIAELENADFKAVFEEARKELGRANELYKSGLISIANLENSKKMQEVARLNYEKTIIRAPFEGMITAMNLKIGEYYQGATTIDKKPFVQIIDLKKRLIKGEIDEIDLQKVTIGNSARVKIPALKSRIFNARVTNVVPFVSTAKDQDRTSQIELEIIDARDDNGLDLLIPVGASADVEIISETKNNVKILPSGVMFGSGKSRSLYKIINGRLKKSEVKLGTGNYERVEVLSGIEDGDLVARPLNGIEMIDGMKVEAIEKSWP